MALPSLSNGGPQVRVSSPTPGRSTLTTCAPKSANNIVAYGPAKTLEKSAILIPAKGGFIFFLTNHPSHLRVGQHHSL